MEELKRDKIRLLPQENPLRSTGFLVFIRLINYKNNIYINIVTIMKLVHRMSYGTISPRINIIEEELLMSEQIMCGGRDFAEEISRYIGQTVTIYTTSGGQSGDGFTGVVISVNRNFVKLITRIGTAPGWPLDNARGDYGGYSDRGYNIDRGFRLGSVTDIPVNRISAFVHNAV